MSTDAVVTGPPGSAAVAAGSAGTVRAGVEVLRAGGSAVDAVLACAFASAVHEPVLSSLGGGGFLLHAPAGAEPELLDFFVAVPGLGAGADREPHVETVVVDFAKAGPAAAASEQVFHGGWGTVAVPGCLAGYLDAHARWGRLPLADVVAPAARDARAGVDLSPVQRRFLLLVRDLLSLTADSAALFAAAHDGHYANPAYADLLDALAAGALTGAHDPAYAEPLLRASREGGGLLTADDLATYAPQLREPLATTRRGVSVRTNPAPAAGGPIVVDALDRLGEPDGSIHWASVAGAQADAVEEHRRRGQAPKGTTHMTVVAADGSVAALTTSNGSQSGALVPGWGVALNNMLGEEDLQPGEPLPPGARMGSMMSPTLLAWPDGRRVALGTGGSERIRSAVLCTVARLVDEGDGLAEAVAAPRVHVGGDGTIHVEPGLPTDALDGLGALAAERGWPALDAWPSTNIYFGGVHAVDRGPDGAITAVGDARRGGAAAVLHPDGTVHEAWSES